MMRPQKNNKKGKPADKRLGWDDWQRYVQKETQRIMKKSGNQVVEVRLSEGDTERKRRQAEESAPSHFEQFVADPSEGRRPPVPGVPREEALQVDDDHIGRTVRPFRVQDYRNIRPMTSHDLFETDTAVAEEIETDIEEGARVEPLDGSTYEEPLSEESIEAEPMVETVSTPRPASPSKQRPAVEPVEREPRGRKRGRKKKHEDEPGLFTEGMGEHQALNRRRLAKKGRLEREELIEKLRDPVISLEEAATLIGVCKTTVRRYTNRDELECVRTPGQQRRFKLSQVLAFVKRREEDEKSRRSKTAKGK
jgi:excisionase family DNA binding protein